MQAMDTPLSLLGYALGSLYGAMTIGGPLMWALIAASGLLLPRTWHVGVAAVAFMAGFALLAPMSPQQTAFQFAAVVLVAAFGRFGRAIAFRLRPSPAHA